MLHENEAAMYLRDICKNDYMEQSDVKEGKIVKCDNRWIIKSRC